MMITSAWRGVALATSKPKREKSYLAEATLIISIPQQLVAKVSGHKEFDLAQFTISLNVLAMIPPPGVGMICPGKSLLVSLISALTSILKLLFYGRIKSP